MNRQFVSFGSIPSKGKRYPEDIELYVKPLSIAEQVEMDRHGITLSEYYKILLEGITINGNFDKNNLFFHDVQMLDLVRRLYTFDTDQVITIKSYPCKNMIIGECSGKLDVDFTLDQIGFTDFDEGVYNKIHKFSDGTEVEINPITIGDFIVAGRKYFSNRKSSTSNLFLGYITLCITSVIDHREEDGEIVYKVFKDKITQNDYVFNYLSNLYKNKDLEVLKEIEKETVSSIEPITATCPECGELVEVYVTPTTQFHQ